MGRTLCHIDATSGRIARNPETISPFQRVSSGTSDETSEIDALSVSESPKKESSCFESVSLGPLAKRDDVNSP
jgi:hypothetical protein